MRRAVRAAVFAPLALVSVLPAAAQSRREPPPPSIKEPAIVRWEWPRDQKPEDPLAPRLIAPAGFRVNVFARDLESPRMLAVLPDGTVLVSRPKLNDVLALRDRDRDGRVDEIETAASAVPSVHGLAHKDGRVYMAAPTTLYVADVRDGHLGKPKAVVTDLPEGGQHPNRTMGFGPDGLLYISIGSDCNDCAETNPEHATIVRMKPDGTQRAVFARGLRNTIGFGWRPGSSDMWGLDHGTDWRGDDLPPEEVNKLVEGEHYGWPYCWGKQNIDNTRKDPEGTTLEKFCGQSRASDLELPAHAAPIGMAFYDGRQFPEAYQGDAFVALRGSWNRGVPQPPKVVRLRFQNGKPAGVEDFVTGFQSADGRTRWGRLAGMAVGPDGALLFSDDEGGTIYRVSYQAAGTPPTSTVASDEKPASSQGVSILALTSKIEGLKTPESVLHDAEQDVYFISNMAGKPLDKDNNGFIVKVAAEGGGKPVEFIKGGAGGVTLHAPKGLALVDDALWVADIDTLRAFDRKTGAALQTIDLAPKGAKFLNDIAATPEGDLYVTDTGLEAGEGNSTPHVGPDRIFRVTRAGQASVALESPSLAGPNGIAWDAAGKRLLIASGRGKDVLAWSPGESKARTLATGPGPFDGLVAAGDDAWLLTSHRDHGVYVLHDGQFEQLVRRPPRPADIGFDHKRGRLLVPSLDGDWVEVWQVPSSREPRSARQ